MIFGPCPLDQAPGAILAHGLRIGGRVLSKGTVLGPEEIAALRAAGFAQVTVARPGPQDLTEDLVATRLGAALAAPGLRLTAAFSGRVNLVAEAEGVLRVDAAAVARFNAVDEAITLATLPDHARVGRDQLVATLKIIPYAVDAGAVAQAAEALPRPPVELHPFRPGRAALIQTVTPGFKPSLLDKGRRAVADRMAGLGMELGADLRVPHETAAVAAALKDAGAADLILILGASATSDRADVAPAAVQAAGGRITRFGMPVDPGNLLFLGDLGGRPVVGLPGCARAPALNGADWVLERLAAGLEVGAQDIAAMGVGGLLKEVPMRAQPRRRPALPAPRQAVELLLLAAGASRRMGGTDKLLRPLAGEPLIRRAARQARAGAVRGVHVVLPPDRPERGAALVGLDVAQVVAPEAARGMAASLRAGMQALPQDSAAVILAFADMPDVGAELIDALIAAYAPDQGRAICIPTCPQGVRGHPVLFDRRFFESLAGLEGDQGARAILTQYPEFIAEVAMPDAACLTDLDTPEAWGRYESRSCPTGP